jgi:predicted PurR-regulated permease PerM
MRRPTPILISKTVRNLLVCAMIAVLLLIVWMVPIVLVISLSGFAVALVLSFPVHLFSRFVPRDVAILCAFLLLLAVLLLVFYVLVPLFLEQMGALISALPGLSQNVERYLISVLKALDRRDLLPSTPENIAARLGADLRVSLGIIAGNVLGSTLGLVFGTFSFALTIFAIVFVAASLLVIQGALSATALFLIGMPYALALGAWVSITAVIPYLGAWLGAVPAVLVALSISPTVVVLTALVFLVIQQLEGNVLTPRIQSQTIKVPSVIVFLGVTAAGALAGLMGVLFAVPTLAVLRVLFNFFRVRLRTAPAAN